MQQNQNSHGIDLNQKKKRITITLIINSIVYVAMNLPATIFFAFIYALLSDATYGSLFDDIFHFISFANNASVFFTTFIVNVQFRKNVLNFFFIIFNMKKN